MKTPRYKKITAACVVCIAALQTSLPAETEYHDFLLKDGRSFRGRIVGYDHHRDLVSIQRPGKSLVKTAPAVFDEADRLRIKEWYIQHDFMSDRFLEISAVKQACKETTESSDGKAGRIHRVGYIVSIKNKSNIALKNLQLEYGIYYNRRKVNLSSDSGNRGVEFERVHFNEIKPRSRTDVKTVGVVVLTSGSPPTSIPLQSRKIYIEGIWLRITLPLSTGKTLVRDFCYPDNLSKHLTWVEADVSLPAYYGSPINPVIGSDIIPFNFDIYIGK